MNVSLIKKLILLQIPTITPRGLNLRIFLFAAISYTNEEGKSFAIDRLLNKYRENSEL